MDIVIVSPIMAKVNATEEELQRLKQELSYVNESLLYQKKKISDNHWWKQSNHSSWKAAMDDIDRKSKCTLVFDDGDGPYIRPSSVPYLPFPVTVKNEIKYPEAKGFKLKTPFPFKPYYYQEEALKNLIKAQHANVSIGTGLGKTLILMMLCKHYGLNTVVITPFTTIFLEILEQFETYFGKDMVGTLGDGKKKIGKPITVCVAKSVASIKEGSDWAQHMAKAQVLIFDESHFTGCETLEDVCNGVLKNIPYRFFLSGTQTRNDGTLKLLQSVIGETVYEMGTAEGIKGGFVSDFEVKIVKITSSNPNFRSSDPMEVKREMFLYNENIAKWIAKLAEASFKIKNEKTLILVSEVSQIMILKKYLTIPFTYGIGATTKKQFAEYGLEPKRPSEAVEEFNLGKYPILIGSAAVSTGVNIFPTHRTVNWVGGGSEIVVCQGSIGRSLRLLSKSKYAHLHPPKDKVTIFDFDIEGNRILTNHLIKRIGFYKEAGVKISVIESGL